MNISSSLSGLASAHSASIAVNRRSSGGQASNAEASSEVAAQTGASCAGRSSGPPSEFNVQMSTAQFAGSRGQPPADPMASLDSDQDGSVSADEFGLSDASSDVKKLFQAIDADQDGSLSSSEIDGFRSKMQEAMKGSAPQGGHGPGGPMGPPPPRPEDDEDSQAEDSSTTSATSTQSSDQLSQMLQRIAQDYLRVMAGDEQTAKEGSTLSLTA